MIAMLRKPSIAYRVALVGRVLVPVDFDAQPLLSADKVNDVRPDRLLTDELVAAQAARAQATPETKFGLRGIRPQPTGALRCDLVGSAHAGSPPHPTRFVRRPLPASG